MMIRFMSILTLMDVKDAQIGLDKTITWIKVITKRKAKWEKASIESGM